MTYRASTIAETITEIRGALQDYIEATYHMGDPRLVAQRRALLELEGTLFRAPYLESTPRYTATRSFAELALPESASTLFDEMAHPGDHSEPLLHDPPYMHQAEALEATIRDAASLVVTTGTGSGKTESFLLPILAKLAIEAKDSPTSFATPSVRAILLYPMNALVNDQLGRLRLLFGDPRVADLFTAWAGRPARFARYTSRTLYPGVRTVKKDQVRLRSIESFYIRLLQEASDSDSPSQTRAAALVENLQRRGKWPSKPDLEAWFGSRGQHWKDSHGAFARAITRPEDPELFTRHEVLANPPDLLVTNYSMLEYMLMRPLERPVFDATRAWLESNSAQRLLLVIDEAHLYRGAAGAEVGLLLRRLRSRLGIPSERLQVICTSASFNDPVYAREFAAQLSGKRASDFRTVQGELRLNQGSGRGSAEDARALSSISLEAFYAATDEDGRRSSVAGFLVYRSVAENGAPTAALLYDALTDFPPLKLLVNTTMTEARAIGELGRDVFDIDDAELADKAVTALVALGSAARKSEGEPGLLPCRIHAFFRGLPGLWACVDESCTAREPQFSGSPIGQLFGQPHDTCDCGARVFELYTCRNCGAAYARAYTDDIENPSFLWNEPGGGFQSVGGHVSELAPIDLLLEQPTLDAEPAELDLVTGRLNPMTLGERVRQVFLPATRSGGTADGMDENDAVDLAPSGEFVPCGVCGQRAGYGRSSVQDHQTKGDQPFQALVTRQIQVQPPNPQEYSDFAPLRGRKVLAFSDSRQAAARLAPNLQTYSMQDVLRPILLKGWLELEKTEIVRALLSLEDLFLSALIGARVLQVRLRPQLKAGESFNAVREVASAFDRGALDNATELLQLQVRTRGETVPQSLLRGIVTTINDRFYGLQSLALASLAEADVVRTRLSSLPAVPGVAEDEDTRTALVRVWLAQWTGPSAGLWFQNMDASWIQTRRGVRGHTGKFAVFNRWLGTRDAKRTFERDWLPLLLEVFCEPAGNKFRIRAANLGLDAHGPWGYCGSCRTTQRPFPGSSRCLNCGRESVLGIDPDNDPVFVARKGYYRASTVRALADPPESPMAIVAAEHTAQLNAAQSDEVFSKAEEHELLFQDVDIGIPSPGEARPVAIDVLSCTTTMEVGIDIGTLSGVALRNMPPSRASYQQRSGRAGRRGNALATVVAFGSADTHDEHYFSEPDAMIRGRVDDPTLTLDNAEIARRHVTAFLLQRYHEARIPDIEPEEQSQLFEVLGTVQSFRDSGSSLNRADFETWLRDNEHQLREDVGQWLPGELSAGDRASLLDRLTDDTLEAVDSALADGHSESAIPEPVVTDGGTEDAIVVEAPAEEGEERSDPRRTAENLLDRLLYKGVLPRYAFPTDVASFYVFDRDRSTRFRPEYLYAPSQGLPVALSQYAPGRRVWIDGKEWSSGALYSPMFSDRVRAWQEKKLYFECIVCHYAVTESHAHAERGEMRNCPACGAEAAFGTAKNWIRPPGFAHPYTWDEETSPDDQPAHSYATRAKLVAPGPANVDKWQDVTSRIREHYVRTHLLVTNTGPRNEGYTYCTRCGLIEPTAIPSATVAGSHPKPYPDDRDPTCSGGAATRGLVLGTDFISDVLLVSLRVDPPLTLRPGHLATDVVLRTLAEAITISATKRLDIEQGELRAEYRPALTEAGREGLEAEIYLYDTLAGGAGFTRRVADLGRSVFEDAITLLEGCPAHCDRSCYRCLRSFRNKFEHELLDRHLGASLLRYLVFGEEPVLHTARLDQAVDRLYGDLTRHGLDNVTFLRDSMVQLPGIGAVQAPILAQSDGHKTIIGVHGPLTPDHPDDPLLRDAKEYGAAVPIFLADEIAIARNLPRVSQHIIASLS